MRLEGDNAQHYQAVRYDTLATVNKGPLVVADDTTGYVLWRTGPTETASLVLGPAAIRIIRASPYGR